MKKISYILIFIALFVSSGCQTVKSGWNNFVNYSKRNSLPSEDNVTKVTKKQKVRSGKGYLANNKEEENTKVNIQKYSESSNTQDLSVKAYSRKELENIVIDLNKKLDDEKTALRRTKEELSEVKLAFQKQIFSMDNMLEEEKKTNKKLRNKLTDSELDALKARQTLTEIKTSIFGTRNLFQSAYPVYYTVQKGDSLWKIAAKDKIYNDAYKWLEIYHANQQKIEDHDIIYPGLVLKIPRYFELLMTNFDTQESVFNNQMNSNEVPEILNKKEKSEINEENINS